MTPSIFKNMNWLDWILAVGFLAVLGFLANLFLPTYGWALGIIAGIALLYLAKSRRDKVYTEATNPPEADQPKDDSDK